MKSKQVVKTEGLMIMYTTADIFLVLQYQRIKGRSSDKVITKENTCYLKTEKVLKSAKAHRASPRTNRRNNNTEDVSLCNSCSTIHSSTNNNNLVFSLRQRTGAVQNTERLFCISSINTINLIYSLCPFTDTAKKL